MEVPLQRGPGARESLDVAVEWLVLRGPDTGMDPEQEERERTVALAKAVEPAAANDLSAGGEARLRKNLNRLWNAFRRGLLGDPPARVEPLTATLRPKAKVVKARGRVYLPIKTAWPVTLIGTLVTLGLAFRNMQAVWASATKAAPKKGRFRLVTDHRAVNKQMEKVLGVMPNKETEMANLRGAACFGKLDMPQGY